MIYRPLYVDRIMPYVDTHFVKILTGVRRCGKSTMLKMIIERLETERNISSERIVSCRYDSMEYEDMTAKQMYAQLKGKLSSKGKTYLFLDEVQEILKQASYAQLYPRSRRDAIIAFGIMHRETLSEINDKLFAENEKALS